MRTPLDKKMTTAHLAQLAESCISPELAEAAGLYSLGSVDAAEALGRAAKFGTDYAGLVFPYRWPGREAVRVLRVRRDQPDLERQTDGTDKEKNKYLTPPGAPNCFYFPPSATVEMLSDVGTKVIFLEGEKKALAASAFFEQHKEKALLIGLSGVWNWRGKLAHRANPVTGQREKGGAVKGPIHDFELIVWEGRQVEIIFDADSGSNLKVKRARAALAHELNRRGALVKILEMPGATASGAKGFDDLLRVQGAERVAEWLQQARAAAFPTGKKAKVQDVTFELRENGVYAIEDYNGGFTKAVYVCSPLHIVADTCDAEGRNWGRVLRFRDPHDRWHQWAMPMMMLSGDGQEYRKELLDQGVSIGRKAREYLATYLNESPGRRGSSVDRMGWYKTAFILPDEIIGTVENEEIYPQNQKPNWMIRQQGALDDWRTKVAAYCAGNSRLALAVSVAFATPLLKLVGGESGGFHFRGRSSVGKSSTQNVAGSVWGGGNKGYLLNWRATSNGLEVVAESYNDALMCFDELKELSAHEAGEVCYMLANGQGKIRMNKNMAMRRPLEWRLLYLSSGEVSLAEHVEKVGKRLHGGQEVRLIDIEADAEKGYGLFEQLHGFKNGNDFAIYLRQATSEYYGTAIRAFLARLVQEQEAVGAEYQNFVDAFRRDHLPVGATAEASRVANRFALAAFAGRLASEYGITGWVEPEAENAAAVLFADWLKRKGSAPTDELLALRQIQRFLQEQGDARFRRVITGGAPDERTIINRAGLLEKDADNQTVYLIFSNTFQETVCQGFNLKMVITALRKGGWLVCNHGTKFNRWDPESGVTVSFYAIKGEMLAAGED